MRERVHSTLRSCGRALLLFSICLMLFCPNLPGMPQNAELPFKLVVNQASAIDSIDLDTLRRVYLGKQSIVGSQRISRIVVLKDGPVHESFTHVVAGKNPITFLNYWKRLVFTGKGSMPLSLTDENEVMEYLRDSPGAIGYVSNEHQLHSGLKTLRLRKD